MKSKFLQKTALLAVAMMAMGGSNVWAQTEITLSSDAETSLTLDTEHCTLSNGTFKDGHTDSGTKGYTMTFNINNLSAQDYLVTVTYSSREGNIPNGNVSMKASVDGIEKCDLPLAATSDWSVYTDKSFFISSSMATGSHTFVLQFNSAYSGNNYAANVSAVKFMPVSAVTNSQSLNTNAANVLDHEKTYSISGISFEDNKAVYANTGSSGMISFLVNNSVAEDYLFSCKAANPNGGRLLVEILDNENKLTSKTFEYSTGTNNWTPANGPDLMMFLAPLSTGAKLISMTMTAVSGSYAGNYDNFSLTPMSQVNTISLPCASGSFDLTKYFVKNTHNGSWKTNDGSYAGGSLGYTSEADVITYILKVTEAGTYNFGFNAGNQQTSENATTLTFNLKDVNDVEYMNNGSAWVKPITDGNSWGNVSFDGCTTSTLAPGYYFFTITWTAGATNIRLLHFDQNSVSYTIPSSGLGTYCCTQKLDFSGTGATPYIITSSTITDNKINTTPVEGVVPAGTGIIVKGEGGATVIIPVSTADAASVSDNKLVGVTEATTINLNSANSYYVLSGGEFHPVTTNGTIAANRAYLVLEGGAPSRSLALVFGGDETTGIDNLNLENVNNNRYFDLQGRVVAQPTKGLYIVNGKKVIIK